MKRSFALILSALLTITLLAPLSARAAGTLTLSVSADKTSVAPGDTVEFTVKVTENPGFFLLAAASQFDKTAFSREGKVRYGTIGTGTEGINAVVDGGNGDTTAVGTLFYFTLRVNDDAPAGSYVIGLRSPMGGDVDVVNAAEQIVPCTFNTVTVEVTDPGKTENVWKTGSDEDLSFDLDPAQEIREGSVTVVTEDGTEIEVKEGNYSYKNGVFKLNKDFLAELDKGNYTIRFQQGDDILEENFKIVPPVDVPTVILCSVVGLLLLAAVAVLIVVLVKKRRSR